MGRSRPSVRELGHRRSARIEALEICKAAAAEEEAARAAQEAAQNPLQEPQTTSEPVRRRGRKKQKCRRTVKDVLVVNSVDQSTGHEQVAGYSDNPNDHHDLHTLDQSGKYYSNPTVPADKQVVDEVLNMLERQDRKKVFAEPVNPLEVDFYYDVIKRPMDFSTMRIKLEQGKYETLEQFEHDVFLMCQNALTFNDSHTMYYREAFAMRAVAVKIFRSLRTQPTSVGCKLEDHDIKKMKRSYCKSVSTSTDGTVKSRNNITEGGGGYRSGATVINREVVLALPACTTRSLASTSSTHGIEDPLAAARARAAPETNSRSRRNGGRRLSVVAEEREIKAHRPFDSFLSSDEATASTVYNQRPAPLVPAVINGGSYTESLRNFTRDMGPKVREIAEGKIKEIEMKEQQLRAAAEAEMTANRRMEEQRQLLAAEDRIRRLTRGKGLLQEQPAGRSPSAGSTDHHHHHHHHHHHAAVNDVLSTTSLQFRPGEFMAALMTRNDGPPPAATGVGDDQGRFAMPGTRVSIVLPGKSSSIINVDDHHQVLGSSTSTRSTRPVSPISLDPAGPSFVVPPSRSSTPAAAVPDIPSLQSWQYVHAAPNLQQVLPMQSGSSLHQVMRTQLVDPTGLGQLPYHSDGPININNINSDLVGNRGAAGQYSSNWQQLMGTQQQHHPPGFGPPSTAGATQFQERRPQYDPYSLALPGLPTTHLQYSGTTSSNSDDPRRPLELSNIYQFQQQPSHVLGSTSSANPQQQQQQQVLAPPNLVVGTTPSRPTSTQQQQQQVLAPPNMVVGTTPSRPTSTQQQQQQQVLAPPNMVVGTTPSRPTSTQQQGLMQFNRYDHVNMNVHPIMSRHRHVFPSSIDHMGPISTTAPSPGVAWMMKAFGTTAGGGDDDRPPITAEGQQPGPPSSNRTDHQGVVLPSHKFIEPGSSSGGGDAGLPYHINNQRMGPNNWVNHQMGSSPTGPMGLLLTDHGPPSQEYNNLGRNIDTTAGPVSDPLAQQSTAGIFDISLVQSCLRSAADRKAADAASREPPGLLRSSFTAAGEVSTSQQLQPTEGEFLEILENAHPADLAHQL